MNQCYFTYSLFGILEPNFENILHSFTDGIKNTITGKGVYSHDFVCLN
jgi:hypothetical protein